MQIRLGRLMLSLSLLSLAAAAQSGGLQLSSTTFANRAALPLSMIHNVLVNGSNVCTVDGSPGGNQSPELSWTNAPQGTVSFAVIMYDVTAAFTHWGIYNIPATATGLPENAGVPGSQFGNQIVNDFFDPPEYDGPCPPPNFRPDTHRYVFTVYAFDKVLKLPSPVNFPASAETLYQALISAGRRGRILRSASITGVYSNTPLPQ